jgi:DNA-binding SARP family transcriptional activator/ABC-type branched-subunit amino acid transport system substrate-binding protein
MRFEILGPLQLNAGGESVPVSGQQGALLVALLLNRNTVVSSDRLVDFLWDGRPPANATKAVHVYVSQLRKLLSEGTLATRAPGYVLNVGPGELDAEVFEQLVAKGSAEEPRDATATLADALELWRGRPLEGFEETEPARHEVARLEELRLVALERRLDAELALGRHDEAVPELEHLVAEHPLRERLRALLMLALYRSGRQADALAVHREGRRLLVDELGLEPGSELQSLERRILDHDPKLDAPPHEPRAPRAARRTSRLLAFAAALLALAGAVVLAVTLARGNNPTAVGPNQLLALDLGTGKIDRRIGVGHTPTAVAVGPGGIWTLNADDQTVSRIDPKTGRTAQTFGTGSTPVSLAVGAGAVWVANGRESSAGLLGGAIPVSVSRLDPDSAVVSGTTQLPNAPAGVTGAPDMVPGGNWIVARPGAVWAIGPGSALSRLDPRTGDLVATVPGVTALAIAADAAGVWAVGYESEIVRIDARTNRLARRIPLAAGGVAGIALGGGSVWVADPVDGTVWRIEPGPPAVTRTFTVGVGVTGVAYGHGALWAVNFFERTVSRIDPGTNRVTSRTELDATPQSVAVGADAAWVSATAPVRGPLVAGVHSLPRSSCGPVESGGRTADVLIASDLPLQGGGRATTLAIAEGIRFVLARHGFRAGNRRVAYQSCDDATAQSGGYDLGKCGLNAKAYADDPSVVGVIGTYNSACASVEIPITNKATDGPLAMLSPSNTNPALTRGTPAEFRLHYPTGARSFVRIAPPDDVQGAAHALLAKRLGLQRVFVLSDRETYGDVLAGGFRRAAAKLGLDLVGSATWKPKEPSYAHLARRIERSRAQAVLLAGVAYFDGGRVAREIHSRLPHVQLLAGDGFLRIPDFRKAAGAAAIGTYVSYSSAANSGLPAGGQAFLRAFAQAHPGQMSTSFSAAYGAAAAETMLAAITASDGSRASVNRELRRVRIENGILGSFGFTPEGDVSPAPITIVRVVADARKQSTLAPDFNGAVFDRVLWVPMSLRR